MPTESRTLTFALDEHTVALAAEALRGEADRRRRAGVKLSAELNAQKRDGTLVGDIRTGAVQVVGVLAEADSLTEAAELLTVAWDAGKPPRRSSRRRDASAVATPAGPDEPSAGDDDDVDDGTLDLGEEARTEGDATVLDHGDDPDVAAARAALGGGEPAAVAPAAPPTVPGT